MIEVTQKLLNSQNERNLNVKNLEKIVDFVKNFADKYHHLKEEDELFMEMERFGMPREGGPIGVMLHEHDEGRKYIKNATQCVEKFKSGDTSVFGQIKDNLLNYCTLLTNHIYKENKILYPMAERILPANVQSQMSDNFEKANASTFENEYHDKYLKMVKELSALYNI